MSSVPKVMTLQRDTLFRWAPVLLIIAVVWAAPCSQAASKDSCSLSIPPKESAATIIDGGYFFIFPRKVTGSYTGCQTMWDERGAKWLVLTFKDGDLTDLVATNPQASEPDMICHYRDHLLISGSSEQCNKFGRNALGPVEQRDEPKVPHDRDPRSK